MKKIMRVLVVAIGLCAPALCSAFQLSVCTLPAASLNTLASRRPPSARSHARASRHAILGGLLSLRASGVPPPPPEEDVNRVLSKSELADLNIQLLEAGKICRVVNPDCRKCF